MKLVAVRSAGMSRTANGPASGPPRTANAPPRTSAPGAVAVVLAPARHMSSLLKLPQPTQFVDCGTQSAPHSATLPTMSKAPRAETHPLREAVGVVNVGTLLAVLQSVV